MIKTLTQNSLWQEVSVYLLELITEEIRAGTQDRNLETGTEALIFEESLLACFLVLPVLGGIVHSGLSPPTAEGKSDGDKFLS